MTTQKKKFEVGQKVLVHYSSFASIRGDDWEEATVIRVGRDLADARIGEGTHPPMIRFYMEDGVVKSDYTLATVYAMEEGSDLRLRQQTIKTLRQHNLLVSTGYTTGQLIQIAELVSSFTTEES